MTAGAASASYFQFSSRPKKKASERLWLGRAREGQHPAQLRWDPDRFSRLTVDCNPYKHGCYTPGMQIPIHPSTQSTMPSRLHSDPSLESETGNRATDVPCRKLGCQDHCPHPRNFHYRHNANFRVNVVLRRRWRASAAPSRVAGMSPESQVNRSGRRGECVKHNLKITWNFCAHVAYLPTRGSRVSSKFVCHLSGLAVDGPVFAVVLLVSGSFLDHFESAERHGREARRRAARKIV